MKKMVRILSVIMLVAMMMSILNVAAFAEVFDSNGNAVSGNSSDNGLVVSADPNAELVANEKAASSAAAEAEDAEAVPVEAGSQYSILSTSASALDYFSSEEMLEENPIIYYNAKYIVYLREHMDELKVTNPDVIETAYALFGEKYMNMEFGKTTTVVSKSVALKAQADSLASIIEKLEALQADPTDADGILALRKVANAYRDTFSGVANYDFTAEESAFGSLEAALDAAKAELANVNAEIEKLGSEGEKKEEKKAEEAAEEVEETPAPEITPTPNEAIAAGALFMSPMKMFLKLMATPLVSVSDLAGKTMTLSSTVNITGLPDWPIVVTLDNAVLTAPAGAYAFSINGAATNVTIEACTIYGNAVDVCEGSATLKFVNVIDNTGDAIPAVRVRNSGSRLEIGNCELSSNGGAATVDAESGTTLYINGYNKINNSGATNAAVFVNGANVTVDDSETTQSIISNVNYTGLRIDSGSVTAKGNAKFSGKSGVIVNSGSFVMQDNVRVDGIGKASPGTSPAGAAIEVTKDSGSAYIANGELYAEYGYAIYTNTKPARCYVANDQKVICTSKVDCKDQYSSGIITVNGKAFANATEANNEISAKLTVGEKVNVELLGDLNDTVPLTVANPGEVSINGNGHTFKTSAGYGLAVSDGTVNVSNISLEAPVALGVGGVSVTPMVSLNNNTILKGTTTAIVANTKGEVSVNDATMYGDQAFSITGDAKVTVNSCKDNCKNPVGPTGSVAGKDNLLILGGYYLYKYTTESNPINDTYVEYYVPEGVASISEKANSDGYYVVTMEYTPTVEIVNGTTGYDENGIPYVVYDKANPKYITFNVDPKVLRIDAVPEGSGTSVNIFNNTAKGGTEGEIVIDIDAFQMNLGSGVYDLQFKFKNGYVLSQKLHLEVLPEVAKLVARSNFADASPASVNAKDINKAVSEYTVGAKQYVYAEVSELPTRIGVSADPNGEEGMTWFDYYNKQTAPDGVRVLQKDNGHYYILVDYAFLDQLSAGQDYIFLDYDGAVRRLDLKIVNPNVSIDPTYLSYWGTDGKATFTVKPDFKDVYIDGKLVPTEFVKYDTDTHKLTIDGEYLNQLPKGDHLMEVETSKGWLSSTVHTGVALRPDPVDYHVYGGAKALNFVASDVIDTSAGIWIGKNNPVQIPADMIYFYNNNTKFTVSPSYLNRLALGTYYISAYVWNGEDYEYTSTTFRIVSASSAAYNPNTGDTFNPVVWIVIAALAAVIVVVFLVPALKKKGGAEIAKAAEEVIKEEQKK